MKCTILILLSLCLLLPACGRGPCDLPLAPGAVAKEKLKAEKQGDLEFFILHCLGSGTLRGEGFTEVDSLTMFNGSFFIPARYEAETDEYGVINGMDGLPEEYVLYTITQWPDVLSGTNYVTGITITDPAVHVFGITTKASAEEFMAAVTAFGLEAAPPEDMDPERIASLDYARAVSPDGTWYVCILNDGETRTISFYAPTTNEWGVMF